MIGAMKVERVAKTKFRKNGDESGHQKSKQKHHDRSFYRLMKEDEEYVYSPSNTKTNRRD
jgi:hypothetical protein